MESTNRRVKKKLGLKTQVKFLRRFTELIENGFSVTDALEVMAAFMTPELIGVLQKSCEQGAPFSEALAQLKFETRIVYIVRASEKNNALLNGLKGARNYSENYLKNRSELGKKLRYPLFLFAMVVLVMAAVFLFFIPRLDEFYETFGIGDDRGMIAHTIAAIGTILLLFSLIFAALTLVFKWDNEKFQWKCHAVFFKLYGLRHLSARLFSYYFATQITLFVSCGLSFKDSLTSIRQFETVPLVQVVIKEIETRVENGESIEQIVRECPCFTPYFRLITIHALRLGKLDVELASFVKAELTQLNAGITSFIKVFQGAFLALTGGLIVMLYLSILQPVFELITVI